MQVEPRVVVAADPADRIVTQYLVVSVDIFDADGEGELDRLMVTLPDVGLRWDLPRTALDLVSRDGQDWYTTPHLTVSGAATLPDRTVELVAIDLSGREARRTLELPTVETAREFSDLPRLVAGEVVTPPGTERLFVAWGHEPGTRIVREAVRGDADEPVRGERVYPAAEIFTAEMMHTSRRGAQAGPPVWLIAHVHRMVWLESGPWYVDPSAD